MQVENLIIRIARAPENLGPERKQLTHPRVFDDRHRRRTVGIFYKRAGFLCQRLIRYGPQRRDAVKQGVIPTPTELSEQTIIEVDYIRVLKEALAIFLVGIPVSLSLGPWSDVTLFGMTIFDFMDYVTANLLLPLGGIAISLFVGWVIFLRALEEATSKGAHPFLWAAPWRFISRYIAPLAIAWILIAGL